MRHYAFVTASSWDNFISMFMRESQLEFIGTNLWTLHVCVCIRVLAYAHWDPVYFSRYSDWAAGWTNKKSIFDSLVEIKDYSPIRRIRTRSFLFTTNLGLFPQG
jgi:hypothetical protein